MRKAEIKRTTKETDISLDINLDGDGSFEVIDTGIGFFDHMLELFAVHGAFDMNVKCNGDIKVDGHHSVEDIGICLGNALRQALSDKRGIRRYASVSIPMDEALANVALDISGRAYIVFNADIDGKIGDFDSELVEEFMRAVAVNAGITLHVNLLYGGNNHHKAEAIFKAFARALRSAVEIVSDKIPSSKGVLE